MLEPSLASPHDMKVLGPLQPRFEEILTDDALRFLSVLSSHFAPKIEELLQRRNRLEAAIRGGLLPDFLPDTEHVRQSSWTVATIPLDLRRRRVEITGPVERKMMINAFNSGADVYMADFEDSHSPTWSGTVQGQVNLKDAVRGKLEYASPEGKHYSLNKEVAVLMVRPRGLHLVEKHVTVKDEPVPAPLFDFGLYAYHNTTQLLARGTAPYFYLPKLESHLEARLWNDIFATAESELGIPRGTIKCSVLIENILAAFEMDEIFYELRDRLTALNFGRWDYIFSFIKKLGHDRRFLFPDRNSLTMAAPFLRACSRLLVHTCHKRGAYAIGGMAAQVPIRNNPEAQAEAMAKVLTDKRRELSDGYEGAWVAHPDLVSTVRPVFESDPSDTITGGGGIADPQVTAGELLAVPEGSISEAGLEANIEVSLRYLESWLRGQGCVAIHNLMEDAATVEICRSLLWQWTRHKARLNDGRTVTHELVSEKIAQNLETIRHEIGEPDNRLQSKWEIAGSILVQIASGDSFTNFMTSVAYDYLEEKSPSGKDVGGGAGGI